MQKRVVHSVFHAASSSLRKTLVNKHDLFTHVQQHSVKFPYCQFETVHHPMRFFNNNASSDHTAAKQQGNNSTTTASQAAQEDMVSSIVHSVLNNENKKDSSNANASPSIAIPIDEFTKQEDIILKRLSIIEREFQMKKIGNYNFNSPFASHNLSASSLLPSQSNSSSSISLFASLTMPSVSADPYAIPSQAAPAKQKLQYISQSIDDLATIALKRKNIERAETLLEGVIRIRESLFGMSHLLVAEAKLELAKCYFFRGRVSECFDLCVEILDIKQTASVAGIAAEKLKLRDLCRTVFLLHFFNSFLSDIPCTSAEQRHYRIMCFFGTSYANRTSSSSSPTSSTGADELLMKLDLSQPFEQIMALISNENLFEATLDFFEAKLNRVQDLLQVKIISPSSKYAQQQVSSTTTALTRKQRETLEHLVFKLTTRLGYLHAYLLYSVPLIEKSIIYFEAALEFANENFGAESLEVAECHAELGTIYSILHREMNWMNHTEAAIVLFTQQRERLQQNAFCALKLAKALYFNSISPKDITPEKQLQLLQLSTNLYAEVVGKESHLYIRGLLEMADVQTEIDPQKGKKLLDDIQTMIASLPYFAFTKVNEHFDNLENMPPRALLMAKYAKHYLLIGDTSYAVQYYESALELIEREIPSQQFCRFREWCTIRLASILRESSQPSEQQRSERLLTESMQRFTAANRASDPLFLIAENTYLYMPVCDDFVD